MVSVGSIYYIAEQASGDKSDLEKKIEKLEKENEDLKKDNDILKKQNKRYRKKIQDLLDQESNNESGSDASTSSSSQSTQNPCDDKSGIKAKVTTATQGLYPGTFTAKDIKCKDGWATATSDPDGPGWDPQLFLLQHKNNQWEIVDYSTGLDHDPYPHTPAETW